MQGALRCKTWFRSSSPRATGVRVDFLQLRTEVPPAPWSWLKSQSLRRLTGVHVGQRHIPLESLLLSYLRQALE